MGDMGIGNIGSLLGGLGSAAGAAGGIASSIQGKNAAQQAAKSQQAAVQALQSSGNQSSLLGLAQLDLQRQLAERQIQFSNDWLAETQPFRNFVRGRDGAGPAPTWGSNPQSGELGLMGGISTPVPTLDPLTAQGVSPVSGITLPERTFAPTLFTQTPAERDAIESQFRNAREQTISRSGVRGGQLGSALNDLNMGRANAVVGLESNLARQNQSLQNAAALTNFQALLDADRFNATDAINARNMNFADAAGVRNMNFADAANVRDANANRQLQTALADRNLAAQIGFSAPGVALPALQSAQQAFNPGAAAAIFNPALAAQGNAASVFSQNFASANQLASGGGQGLGSLAAAGKLAGSKGGGGQSKNTQTMSQFFGK